MFYSTNLKKTVTDATYPSNMVPIGWTVQKLENFFFQDIAVATILTFIVETYLRLHLSSLTQFQISLHEIGQLHG